MIGYCCICLGINEGKRPKDHIKVNRGMIQKTFNQKGLSYVSELSILNLKDLLKVLQYNIDNDIYLYRMSSEMLPWFTHYKIKELPNFNIIENILKQIGKFAIDNKIRLSFHAPPFCILGSEDQRVVSNSIDELDKHAELLDLMQLDQSDYYPINVHVNTTRPTNKEAAKRFCNAFDILTDSCKKRLTVENDDKLSQFSINMLYEYIYKRIKIPITFDQFHYLYGPQDSSMEDSLKLALSTWKTKPLTHMSSSRRLEDPSCRETAHADFIYEKIKSYGLDFDTDLECKAKDLGLIKYKKDFF